MNLKHFVASHRWGLDKECRPRSDASDQIPQIAASDQGLHCLDTGILLTVKENEKVYQIPLKNKKWTCLACKGRTLRNTHDPS